MAVKRGEVYFIELSPTRGREQSGRRPVVVVSNDTINSRPLVEDPSRFDTPPIGTLSDTPLRLIDEGLAWTFDIEIKDAK